MVIRLILFAIPAAARGWASAIRNGRPRIADARRDAFAQAGLARAGAAPTMPR